MPAERPHGEIAVSAVTALRLAVMPERIRTEEFISNTEFRKRFLKERWEVGFGRPFNPNTGFFCSLPFCNSYIYTGSAGKLGIAKRCAR